MLLEFYNKSDNVSYTNMPHHSRFKSGDFFFCVPPKPS